MVQVHVAWHCCLHNAVSRCYGVEEVEKLLIDLMPRCDVTVMNGNIKPVNYTAGCNLKQQTPAVQYVFTGNVSVKRRRDGGKHDLLSNLKILNKAMVHYYTWRCEGGAPNVERRHGVAVTRQQHVPIKGSVEWIGNGKWMHWKELNLDQTVGSLFLCMVHSWYHSRRYSKHIFMTAASPSCENK